MNHTNTLHTSNSRSHQPPKYCWLKIAIFDAFPRVPSVFGREVQENKILFRESNSKKASKTKHCEVIYTETPEEKNYYYDNNIDPSHLLNIITVEVELFTNEAPLTCENFYQLCDAHNVSDHMNTYGGGKGKSSTKGGGLFSPDLTVNENDVRLDTTSAAVYQYKDVIPSFKGTFFHKIIRNFIIQGGDISLHVEKDGKNFMHTLIQDKKSHNSTFCTEEEGLHTVREEELRLNVSHHQRKNVYRFHDENKKRRHNQVGLLSMANNGPNTNATQFFIVSDVSDQNEKALNGRHTVFGRIISDTKANKGKTINNNNNNNKKEQEEEEEDDGLELLLYYLKAAGDVTGKPSKFAIVIDCGQGRWEEPQDEQDHTNTVLEEENKMETVKDSEKEEEKRVEPEKKKKHVSYKE